MSASILRFPHRLTRHQQIIALLVRYWREGKRQPELGRIVKAHCPDCTLQEFNAAADEAWAEIGGPT
jgi:hypothetical protein